jgi:hypothetical protein
MESEYRNTALCIMAAIIISIIISIALGVSVVQPYLNTTNRAINLFEFYKHVGPNKIYFIGSSQIQGDIDASLIKDAYNLGLSADTPLRRIIELPAIVHSKPRAVIIGLTYFGLNDTDQKLLNTDNIGIVADETELNLKKWFTDEELKQINVSLDYYRVQIIPGVLSYLSGNYNEAKINIQNGTDTNSSISANFENNFSLRELMFNLDHNMQLKYYIVSEKDYRQKQALFYTIRELQKAGIKTAIINMPLHPLLSARISSETRKNYFDFLNYTGVEYYDFETYYSGEYFRDLNHLNSAGRKRFSEQICTIVQ